LTGWRVGEALRLKWAEVEFDVGVVRLRPGTTKNREGRVFPFAALPELEVLLRRQRERTETVEKATHQIVGHVFHRTGQPIKCYKRAWNRACKEAGVPHLWVHDLRRSAVRRLIRSGVPQAVAMQITGHKTASVFRRYGIITESDLTEAVKKVAEFRKTERGDELSVASIGHSLATIRPNQRSGAVQS
jgi:integrase